MESSNFPPEVTPSQNTLAPQALSMPIGVRLENIAEFEVYSSSVLEQPVIAKDSYFYSTPWFKFTGMDPNAKYQLSLRFDKVSNGSCLRKGAVVLESSYKYQAVLLVSKIVEQGTTVQLDTPQEFRFDCMTFIVVHKYRNPEIFKMKAHPKGCKRKSRSAIEVPSSTTLFSIASLISPDETKKDSVTSAPAAPVNFQFPIGPTSFASSATLLLPNWTNKTLLENAGSDHLQPYNTPSCTGSSEDISNQYDSAVAVLLSTQPHLPSGTSSSNISFPLGPRSFAAFSPFFPSNCIFPFAPPGNFK
ncbi:hypothetical protein L5515_017373 [Caenorhabditis briggsae]|uniref:T-box domain-containing protein n=1 Tax=Caenorhabditis briggsae TaxID=6238 RepID=A0AAE9FF74_CAEBR|nr:hypothetical protein L5515_017373 [Caenorhabditis briggsae]